MLRALIAISLLSVSSLRAFALPAPAFLPAARLQFTGRATLELLQRYETVYAFNEDGQEKLKRLREKGFICQHKERMIFLCSKLSETLDSDLADYSTLARQFFSSTHIRFFEPAGQPELMYQNGDFYQEWRMPQGLEINGRTYASHRYRLSGGLRSYIAGEPAETGVVANDDGTYGFGWEFTETLSREVYVRYIYSGDFAFQN